MSIPASTYKKRFLQKRAVLAVVERLFWQLGPSLVAVAVVERFNQEVMYGLSAGTKKSGRCGEVAVSGGSTVSLFPPKNQLYTWRGLCLREKTFHMLNAEKEDFEGCMPRKAEKTSSIISSSKEKRRIS